MRRQKFPFKKILQIGIPKPIRFPLKTKGWGKWIIIIAGILLAIGIIHHKFFKAHSKIVPALGGIYTEATIGTIKNLSPFATDSTTFDKDIQSLIFEGLLKYNPIEGKFESGLAEMQIQDPQDYILTLKDKIYFHNGEPVKVEDVFFTFENVLKNPGLKNKPLFKTFEFTDIKIIDEKTIEIILPEPNTLFPFLLTQIPILPQSQFQNIFIEEITDASLPFNKHPIGTGPFVLKNVVPNDDGTFRAFLERNKKYHGEKPKIEQIVFYAYPNYEMLKKSIKEPMTSYSQIPIGWTEDMKTMLEKKFPKTYTEKEYILPRYLAIFFNLDKEITKQLFFRKGLSLGIDREKIIEGEKDWIPVGSLFFFEGREGMEGRNFAKARSTLQDGGFPYNKAIDGRTIGKSEKQVIVKMITPISPPSFSRMAQIIAQKWEFELGIKTKLEILEKEELNKKIKERDYDILFIGENFSENFDVYSSWHTNEAKSQNLSNLTNRDIDFVIEEIRAGGSKMDMILLNEKLNNIVPAIPISTPKFTVFSHINLKPKDSITGERLRSHSHRFYKIPFWYFKEKKTWDIPLGESKWSLFWKWITQKNKTENEKKESPQQTSTGSVTTK